VGGEDGAGGSGVLVVAEVPGSVAGADGVVAGAEGIGGTAVAAASAVVEGVGWSARACATANSGTAIVATRTTQFFIRSTSFIR
jgi:hypothetical protein